MSSFLTQNSSSEGPSISNQSFSGSYLTNKMISQSDDTPNPSQTQEQYRQYVQRKKQHKSRTHYNNQISLCRKTIYALIISFIVFLAYSFLASSQNIREEKTLSYQKTFPNPMRQAIPNPRPHAFPNPRPQAFATPGTCNSYLPYSLFSRQSLEREYKQWYGKVGSNINGMSYEPGHFIERHVASNGQCTYSQKVEGKTVFYDWSQVIKAFQQTQSSKCPLSDYNSFSYDHQIRIASPSDYIKGIDCRRGTIKKFSKIFVLYRKTVKSSHSYQDEYLSSKHLTIWTFYPKH